MITAGLDALAAVITARMETVPVTRDPAEINPPCVFLDTPQVIGSTLSGGLVLLVPVVLLVKGPGGKAAGDALLDLLPDLLDACQEETATPGSFTTDPAEKPLPSMTVPTTLTIDRS